MENQSHQLETILEACRVLSKTLKDPTDDNKKQLTSEQRNSTRDEAYESLMQLLDAVEAMNDIALGFVHALNIVNESKK